MGRPYKQIYKNGKEWAKGSTRCPLRTTRREDCKTVVYMCTKTGDKCNCALCPKVKKTK